MPSDTPTVMHQNRVVFPRTHTAIHASKRRRLFGKGAAARCIKPASYFRENGDASMHQCIKRVVFPRETREKRPLPKRRLHLQQTSSSPLTNNRDDDAAMRRRPPRPAPLSIGKLLRRRSVETNASQLARGGRPPGRGAQAPLGMKSKDHQRGRRHHNHRPHTGSS
jgi:hypothetical protein